MNLTVESPNTSQLIRTAWWLSLLTIVYNIAEGLIAVWQGWEDESLTLFGFGVDSFVEVSSAIGIAYMVFRMQKNPVAGRSDFERQALQITGWGFYVLTAGLTASALYNVYTGHRPENSFWSVVISSVSISIMWLLIRSKERVGRALNSAPIMADAACARVCLYMSGILLLSGGLYALTGFAYADAIGALGLAWFSYREGKESFEKARGGSCGCDHCEA
ncbi:hypothetical protein F5984_04090 [Rudanella paleaurantiibacter]|uniref:Cation efflux protein transmembrane domain-containing protein n=1 Tax=Rudanella paleaurantiibacter TaxID=2614655 RepID=A0A7J5U6B5_9BACT|nr:cation transporter [Rudanella paleaurantiibacter]KAB7733127.1 hypothetical protein F5984_04090 [Rudanella paleaurantiibacter]